MPAAEYTDFTLRALSQVRDTSGFGWGVVPLIALVFYIYTVEVNAKRWPVVFAGVGLFLMDIFNEVANTVIMHVSHRAALWTTTGPTLYQPLVGLTIEIMFLFAIGGIIFAKALPEDRSLKILGVNNRLFLVTAFSVFSVFVELLLRAAGIFHWEYWFWNWPFVPLIVIFGYGTFYGIAGWLYDMGEDRRRQFTVVGALGAIDLAGIVLFGPVLGWL